MQQVDVIAIDGPVASGKGSVSARVAKILGFNVLDSGSLYRLTAYASLKKGADLDNESEIAVIAAALKPVFSEGKIFLEDEDVTDAIRHEDIGLAASRIAIHPVVRKELFDLQRAFAEAPGLVADGRDMGSIVFPEAVLKVFLTASAEARAERRFNQLRDKGISSNIDSLVQDLKDRDERDMKRSAAPLVPAEGAKILDSSDLTLDETVNQVLEWYREIRQH